MENDELLHKWVNGTLSAEELDLFKKRSEYESLVALYKNTDDLSAPSFDKTVMLEGILSEKKEQSAPPQITGRRVFLSSWMKYAAAAVIVLAAAWFIQPYFSSAVVHELSFGQRLEGTLPDESTFVLNAESRLVYHPKDWETERSLALEGEAFFKVEKGSQFKVLTPIGSVQVLGTQFNVRAREQSLDVSCHSGKVAVLDNNGKLLDELNPNEAIRIESDKVIEKWTLAPSEKTGWVYGVTKLKKVPLATVLAELERQFGIQVQTNGVNTSTIMSCNFQHQDLHVALKTTLTPLGIQYQIKDQQQVVLQK